jgi:hypothetical protein
MLPRTSPYFATDDECRECTYLQPCVTPPPVGQRSYRITPTVALDCIYRGLTPTGSIRALIDGLERQVRKAAEARYGSAASAGLSGGIQNVRGDWLEHILGVIFWNTVAGSDYTDTAIVRLPSAAQLHFHEIYEPRARGYLEELFASLQPHHIQMTMSNPDFICVSDLPSNVSVLTNSHLTLGESSASAIANTYEALRGICNARSIPFVLTVKTSVRPDRRYQIVHEANVVKALVAHLAGRFWQKDLYTAFYAMVASPVSDSDRGVLRNPATHSLVQVSWTPAPLVDEVYSIDSVDEVHEIISQLLNTHLGAENHEPTS